MRKTQWFALMLFLALCICCAQADVLTFPSDLTTIAEEAFAGDTSLDEAVLPERLNAIGRHAFAYSSLRRVYLPETLNSIGDDAFLGCQDLVAWGYPDTYGEEYCREKGIPYEAISTPAEEFAFSFPNDSEATVTGWMGEGEIVIIPEMADETHRVTAIGNDAFRNNSALKKLYLPTGLVSIGDCAFRDCANLEDVVFHAGLKQIRQGAFCNCDKLRDVDLPDSVEVIGGGYYGAVGAFQDCDALESFHYPSSLTDAPFYEVWRGNLANCPNLKTVTFSEGVTSIAPGTFCGAASLEEIDIPGTVTDIGANAFNSCAGLKTVELPTGLVSIGDCAFRNCANLEDVVFHAGLKQIRQGAFCNCDKLRDVDLPDSVEVIGGGYYGAVGAFQDCDALESFHYPSSLTDAPFYEVWRGNLANCPKFKTVTFGEGVTSIAPGAFCGAASLEEIDIPGTVTDIGANAFNSCAGLTRIYIPAATSFIANDAFASHGEALEIWCEYGSTALQHAVDHSIQYYYLSLVPYLWPSVVYQGEPYSVPGTVCSNYMLTNVNIQLANGSDGVLLADISVDPQNETYALYGDPSAQLDLWHLPLGSYRLTVGAATAKSEERFYSVFFQVKEPPLRINTNEAKLPINTVYPMEYVRLSGVLTANYPITDVFCSLLDVENNTMKVYSAQPNAQTLDLTEIAHYFDRFTGDDMNHHFDIRLMVTAHGETVILSERRMFCSDPHLNPLTDIRLDPLFSRGVTKNLEKRAFWSMRLASEIYDEADKFAKEAYMRDYRKEGDRNLVRYGLMWKDIENTDLTYNRLWVIAVEGTVPNSIDQWVSNLNMGDGSYHQGFMEAANAVMEGFSQYRTEIEEIRPRDTAATYMPDLVWVVGHSRGAAVANLLGGKLLAEAGFDESGIYAACFACPNVFKKSEVPLTPKGTVEVYDIGGDIVPALPFAAWDYGRYGTEVVINSNVIQNEHFPTVQINTPSDIEPLIRTLSSIPQQYAQALLDIIVEKWENGECPQNVTGMLQSWLDAMAENLANPSVIPTSLIGKLEQMYKNFTGNDSVLKRGVNSHHNNTYVTWMYDRYPNAVYNDYLANY